MPKQKLTTYWCLDKECDYSEQTHRILDGLICPKCGGPTTSRLTSSSSLPRVIVTEHSYEEDERKVVEAYKKHGHIISREQAEEIWSEYSHEEFFASWMMMGNDLDVIYDQTLRHALSLGIITSHSREGGGGG